MTSVCECVSDVCHSRMNVQSCFDICGNTRVLNTLRLTCSLKVWFSACTAASSRSLSLSLSCVFSWVLRKLFASSLASTLFWQFSRRDFWKGNYFTSQTSLSGLVLCCHIGNVHRLRWLICYLQADVSRYQGAVHLIKTLHGRRPYPHLWLQTPPLCVGNLQKPTVCCTFRFIDRWGSSKGSHDVA